MPGTLTRFVFAAAIACTALPALGAGMPDYGTKNFSPGGDTPSYFSNENRAVLGATENENTDDGSDTPLRSVQSVSEPTHSDRMTTRHHGQPIVGRRARSDAAAHSRGRDRPGHIASANSARTTLAGRSTRTARGAGAAKTRAGDAGAGKSAKPGVRHASARSSSRKG